MADNSRKRNSRSTSPYKTLSRSRSRTRSKSRGRSRSRSRGRDEVNNPGTTLYVTGLSTRATDRDLEDHFSKEGKVASCFLVVEPRTRLSRGFAFITMKTLEDADRCVKYLNQSVLDGRCITVERSRRKRPRTPTPGHYLGLKSARDRGFRDDRDKYRGGRDEYEQQRYSGRSSPYRGGGRDYSPRRRDHSPPRRPDHSPRRRDYSPQRRDHSPQRRDHSPQRRDHSPQRRDYSPRRRSPYGERSRRERSYSPYQRQ